MYMAGQIADLIAATVFDSPGAVIDLRPEQLETVQTRTIGGLARVTLKLTYGKTIPSLAAGGKEVISTAARRRGTSSDLTWASLKFI
jgi:hypothetical protein